jgi:hypothetical protein
MLSALSDERTGLFLRCTMYKIFSFYMLLYECIYTKYIQGFCQSRLSTADHVLSLVASAYEGENCRRMLLVSA